MTEVRLTPDGVAPLERAQATETPVDDGNEIILKVSQELASMSLGFTVDAGRLSLGFTIDAGSE